MMVGMACQFEQSVHGLELSANMFEAVEFFFTCLEAGTLFLGAD